jgi:hypothetical protein
MKAQEALIHDLPGDAERARRQYWRDPDFRTICRDYRDALRAAAAFEALWPPELGRSEQYRRLAAELLAEATEILARERTS